MAADCKLGRGAASRFHLLTGDALISLPKARREDGAPCKDMSRIGLVAGPGCMQWGRVFASKKRPGLQNKHRSSMSVQFADGRSIAFVVEGVLQRRRKLQRQVLVRVAGSEAVGSWRAVRGASWAMRDVCCFTQCDGDRHQASHTAPPCDRTAWFALPADDCSWRARMGCSGKRSHCDGRCQPIDAARTAVASNTRPLARRQERAGNERSHLKPCAVGGGREGRGDRGIESFRDPKRAHDTERVAAYCRWALRRPTAILGNNGTAARSTAYLLTAAKTSVGFNLLQN